MKKRLLNILILLYSIFGLAQAPTTIDPNFYSTSVPLPISGFQGHVYAVSVQPDDKIFVGGSFSNYNSLTANAWGIIKLNADGTKDTSFYSLYSSLYNVYALAVQNDGKVIIGGGFTQLNSTISRNKIVRLNSDGLIDNSFTIGTGFNNTVKTIVLQPDGKVIVGGDFTSYNGVAANRIIRLNTDGSVDTSFIFGTAFNQTVEKIRLQSDGKLLVCGSFTLFNGASAQKLVRLETNGSRDTSFNIGTGFLYSNQTYIGTSSVVNMAIQSDNKIVAVGLFSTFNGTTANNIVRLNTDGSLDPGLNCGTGFISYYTIANPSSQAIYVDNLVIQNDNKILIGTSSFDEYNGYATEKDMIRINPDGSIDPSFDTTFGVSGNNTDTKIPVLQSDGKIIIAGDFLYFDGYRVPHIARINANGLIDPTFGTSVGFDGDVNNTFEQPDGKILVCGNFGSYNKTVAKRVARLNANGSLDTTFNSGIGFNYNVKKIEAQTDGKILVRGDFTKYNNSPCNGFARLNSDGSLENSFISAINFVPIDFALQADGKIIVVGDSYIGSTPTYHFLRLNSDGTIDSTFNIGTGFNKSAKKITIQPDGKILVGGVFTSYNGSSYSGVIRLNSDGTVDSSFNIGTGFADSTIIGASITKIMVQPDSKIICIGYFTSFNGTNVKYIVRLNANGSYDSTFSTGTFDPGLPPNLTSCGLQSDGKIVVVGDFHQYNGVSCYGSVRMNSDGSRDAGFAASNVVIQSYAAYTVRVLSDGKIIIGGNFYTFGNKVANRILKLNTDGTQDMLFNATGFDNSVNTIALQADNKILTGGTFTTYNGTSAKRIARVNTDGTVDSSFNTGLGFEAGVNKIIVQQDNKILVGGDFSNYNGTTANRIIRLLENGTVDTSFNSGTGFDNRVNFIAVQNDGKIIIAGDFTSYNGITANRIIRLNSDGTKDTGFTTGLGFNNTVYAIAIQSNGKILIGGSFVNYDNTAINGIVRLNSDGTRDTSFVVGSGFNNIVRAIALQSDGKIVAAGVFTTYNGAVANRVARLDTNGATDTTFISGNGFDNYVSTLAIEPDNKILAGGFFSNYKGTLAAKLVRINTTGAIDATFDTTTGFDSIVLSLAIQQDGKILAGGTFNKYKTADANYFIRLMGEPTLATPSFTFAENKTFVLYPNPVSETLNIAIDNDTTSATFKIYNLIGQEVKVGNLNQKEINVSNIKPGIYIFELNDGQRKAAKKFIKR